MNNRPNWVSQHLPPNAREALVKAAQTPFSDTNPRARILAVDAAIDAARASNPELFQQEK